MRVEGAKDGLRVRLGDIILVEHSTDEPAFFADPFFQKDADPAVIAELRTPERRERVRANPATARYRETEITEVEVEAENPVRVDETAHGG